MEIAFAIITPILVTALAVLAYFCGKFQHQAAEYKFQLIQAKAELFVERADERTRQGLGENFLDGLEDEWPEVL